MASVTGYRLACLLTCETAKIGKGRVCPLLIDIEKSRVPHPLGLFQVRTLKKDEILSVIEMINADASEEDQLQPEMLKETFDQWWPKLESTIKDIKAMQPEKAKLRSEREILEDILSTVRSLANPSLPWSSSGSSTLAEAIEWVRRGFEGSY